MGKISFLFLIGIHKSFLSNQVISFSLLFNQAIQYSHNKFSNPRLVSLTSTSAHRWSENTFSLQHHPAGMPWSHYNRKNLYQGLQSRRCEPFQYRTSGYIQCPPFRICFDLRQFFNTLSLSAPRWICAQVRPIHTIAYCTPPIRIPQQ